MTQASASSPHVLGLRGNFNLGNDLLATAEHYGFSIRHEGSGLYRVHSDRPDLRLESFCPSFIRHRDGVFDFNNLQDFLRFLHQPVRVILDKQKAPENRKQTHELLRFITTGSLEIPSDDGRETDGAEPSCHEDAEANIVNSDTWREEREFLNPKSVSSAVPGTGFSENGFSFSVTQAAGAGSDRNQLDAALWSMLSNVKGQRYEERPERISLTATEFERFSNLVSNPAIKELIERAKFEERVEVALAGIDVEVDLLLKQQPFRELLESRVVDQSPQEYLRLVLRATSALTPIMQSDALRKAWAEFNITHRSDSPFATINDEFEVFNTVMRLEAQKNGLQPERVQAILNRFSSLTAFSRLAAAEMGIAGAEEIFAEAGVTNISVAEEFLSPHHQQALDTIRKTLDQDGSPLNQLIGSAGSSLKTVIGESFNYTTGSKVRLRVITALTSLYLLSTSPAFMKKFTEVTGIGPNPNEQIGYVIGEEGLEKARVTIPKQENDLANPQALTPEQRAALPAGYQDADPSCCHTHVIGPTLVVHCFFNKVIKDLAHGTMDVIESSSDRIMQAAGIIDGPKAAASEFSKNARASISPTANTLFTFNIVQLAAHIPFFAMMYSRGHKYGFRAVKKVSSLFGDFTDSMYSLGRHRPLALPGLVAGAAMGAQQGYGVAGIIMSALAGGAVGNFSWHRSSSGKKCLHAMAKNVETSLAGAAIAREAVHYVMSGDIREVEMGVRIAGLKHKFKISAENLQPVLDALKKFDTVMTEAAKNIGVKEQWYQKFITSKIHTATQALEEFSQDRDSKKLEEALKRSMADIMGAQKYHMNQDTVFRAVFNKEVDADTSMLLERHGTAKYASLKRMDRMKRHVERIGAARKEWSIEEKVKSGIAVTANAVWDGMVRAARATQSAYTAIPHRKAVVSAAGLAAAFCVMLDMSGQSQNVLGPMIGDFTSKILSGMILGKGFGPNLTTGIFGGYNTYDDIFMNDTLGGMTALTAGIVLGHYLYQKGIKRSAGWFKELRNDPPPLPMPVKVTKNQAPLGPNAPVL